ncbi:hypothetical protein BDN67DRAFT_1008665 [Paxillus ammoniavirescens]|nr:hypothetical protein BDN67DRAFT_1008665 [Paxillus ammoniavirescens]
MASPSTHLYPLLVPTAQPANTSSHSSLANALGPESGYSIYLTGPPVTNPSYPYPARNVLNPTTYPARTPLLASNGRRPINPGARSAYQLQANEDVKGLPEISSRHRLLPQPVHVESPKPYGYQPGAEFSAIYFQRKGNKGPYSIGDLLTMDTLPDLVDGNAPLFALTPDRWIKIKLTWPGYARYPFEKRIPIKQGVPLTPTLVLMALASHIDEFVRWIHNEGAIVERGQEQWQVKKVLAGVPAMWKDCVIASLQHRTGSIWQPEIYYLRG